MKNLTSTLGRLTLALTAALALGSCSRAQYATLPRSTPYLGSTPVATRQAAPTPAAPTTPPLATEAVAVMPAPTAPVTPAATPTPATPAVAAVPVTEATPAPTATVPHKLNLVQRLAVKKITKKLDAALAKAPQIKKHDATASTTRGGLDDRLRTAILLTLAAIIIGLIAALVNSGFIGAIGIVVFVIALIFVILYLIDQA